MSPKKLIAIMTLALAGLAQASSASTPEPQDLAKKVRHELLMLPWLGIYDDLNFRIDDAGKVTLLGETIRPTLKSSAASVVKNIPGVTAVENQIEVLPLSPNDDRIRLAVARSIYGYPALNRYSLGAQPSIRVIVKNGNVTLKGVVANDMDSNLAFIQANGVTGAFHVDNQLRVESRMLATR